MAEDVYERAWRGEHTALAEPRGGLISLGDEAGWGLPISPQVAAIAGPVVERLEGWTPLRITPYDAQPAGPGEF